MNTSQDTIEQKETDLSNMSKEEAINFVKQIINELVTPNKFSLDKPQEIIKDAVLKEILNVDNSEKNLYNLVLSEKEQYPNDQVFQIPENIIKNKDYYGRNELNLKNILYKLQTENKAAIQKISGFEKFGEKTNT